MYLSEYFTSLYGRAPEPVRQCPKSRIRNGTRILFPRVIGGSGVLAKDGPGPPRIIHPPGKRDLAADHGPASDPAPCVTRPRTVANIYAVANRPIDRFPSPARFLSVDARLGRKILWYTLRWFPSASIVCN